MVGTAGAVRGRGTAGLKRIEKLSARQVTFAKRRKGLFKKAHEIATLCDAEIGVILFSSTGKLYEFSSSRMTQVIQRHKLYSKHAQNQNPEQTYLEIETKDATDSTENFRRNTSEPPMEWKKLERQCGRLKEENSTLKVKEAALKEENERLRRQLMAMLKEQGQPHKQSIQPPAEADFWDELCQDYIIPESSLLFQFDMPAPHISASGVELPLPNSSWRK